MNALFQEKLVRCYTVVRLITSKISVFSDHIKIKPVFQHLQERKDRSHRSARTGSRKVPVNKHGYFPALRHQLSRLLFIQLFSTTRCQILLQGTRESPARKRFHKSRTASLLQNSRAENSSMFFSQKLF